MPHRITVLTRFGMIVVQTLRCASWQIWRSIRAKALTVKFVSDKVRTLYAFLRSRVRRMVGRFARQSMIDRDYRRKGRSGFPAVR
jgi:hypothetical protein